MARDARAAVVPVYAWFCGPLGTGFCRVELGVCGGNGVRRSLCTL